MALKRIITKAEYDKLNDAVKAEYAEGEDDDEGSFVLQAEGFEDAGELRRAHLREKEDNKKLKKELKETKAKLAERGEDDPPGNGDVKKVDEAWKAKMQERETELGGKLSKKDEIIRKTLLDGTAERIAQRISTVPSLMAKALLDRLDVEFDDDSGEAELIIRGKDGKPDKAMTLEKLEKEFVANKEFASIIIASKASGGGAPRKGPEAKPGGTGASEDKPPLLSQLTGKQLAEHLKQRKAEQDA